MADYLYVAINKEGKQIKGSMQASDVNAVKSKLKLDGLTPVNIKAQSILNKEIKIGSGPAVKVRDLSVFCRQFSNILNAGVTVVDALRMLAEQTDNKTLKSTLIKTKELVQQGETLADAMRKTPKVFSPMFVNMVEAGEASGNLDTCVRRMGTQFEKTAKLQGMVKKAMIYPIVVIIVALVVVIVMSVAVVPKFAEMFSEMGAELPAATKIVMAISNVLITKWWLLIIITVTLIVGLKAFGNTEKGKEVYGGIAIKLPIFGSVNKKSASAQFARTMSTLVGSGLSITAALEITGKAISNILYKNALDKAKLEVEQGIPLSVPIRKSKIFPPMVYNMLAIGEETGSIEDMLDKVADYYEEETEMATANMAEMMQPIIIVVLGAVIGLMVLAMYQPMISMYQDIGNLA